MAYSLARSVSPGPEAPSMKSSERPIPRSLGHRGARITQPAGIMQRPGMVRSARIERKLVAAVYDEWARTGDSRDAKVGKCRDCDDRLVAHATSLNFN